MKQREIKFRAWCYIDYKMYYQSLSGTKIKGTDGNGTVEYYPCMIKFPGDIWPGHDDLDLMQYTGLKDKNGKEIYEGDIVKGREGCLIGDVKFGVYKVNPQSKHDRPDNNLGWYVQGKNEKYSLEHLNWYIDLYLHDIRKDYMEVIGNIYENPELINSPNTKE